MDRVRGQCVRCLLDASSRVPQVFPKLQKVTAPSSSSGSGPGPPAGLVPVITRQETIEEMVELEERDMQRPSTGTGSVGVTGPPTLATASGLPALSQGLGPSASPISGVQYKELIGNIMDFKVDVKLEVQRLNQKVSRMEDILSVIASRLETVVTSHTLASTPASTHEHMHRTTTTTTVSAPPATLSLPLPTVVDTSATASTAAESSGAALTPSSSDGLSLGLGLGLSLAAPTPGSVILKKRRSKSRTKAAAPAPPPQAAAGSAPQPPPPPPRHTPTEARTPDEGAGVGAATGAGAGTGGSASSTPSTPPADDEGKRPVGRRPREFL